MSSAEIYRAKAEDLLSQAMGTTYLGERSRLISEAVKWHAMAEESRATGEVTDAMEERLRDFEADPDSSEPETP